MDTVTVELTSEQAQFLHDAMNWWKSSGVNYWSQKSAQEIKEKLQVRTCDECGMASRYTTSKGEWCEKHLPEWAKKIKAIN